MRAAVERLRNGYRRQGRDTREHGKKPSHHPRRGKGIKEEEE